MELSIETQSKGDYDADYQAKYVSASEFDRQITCLEFEARNRGRKY